jgi:hypothetical protein
MVSEIEEKNSSLPFLLTYRKLATRPGFARVQYADTKVFFYFIMHNILIKSRVVSGTK